MLQCKEGKGEKEGGGEAPPSAYPEGTTLFMS